jgi:hypothetical protein
MTNGISARSGPRARLDDDERQDQPAEHGDAAERVHEDIAPAGTV